MIASSIEAEPARPYQAEAQPPHACPARHHRTISNVMPETAPAQHPLLQQAQVVAFHDLEAAVEIGSTQPSTAQAFRELSCRRRGPACRSAERPTGEPAFDDHENMWAPLVDGRSKYRRWWQTVQDEPSATVVDVAQFSRLAYWMGGTRDAMTREGLRIVEQREAKPQRAAHQT